MILRFLLSLLAPLKARATHTTLYRPTGGIANVQNVSLFIQQGLCPIAGTMFGILLVVSTIMVVIAAYMYLTAAGDAERIRQGHRTITYAAVAVALALTARGFPYVVATIFSTTLGPGCL